MMDWLKSIAPTIATALGGPLGGLAVEAVGKALGMSEATKEKVTEVLSSGNVSMEQMAAIKQAESELALKFKELGIKEQQMYVDDTKDARKTHGGDPKVFKLGLMVLLTFAAGVGSIMWLMYKILVEGMKTDPSTVAVVFTMIGTVIGYLAANAQQVISYYFGSSAGSKEKSDAMAKAVENVGKK